MWGDIEQVDNEDGISKGKVSVSSRVDLLFLSFLDTAYDASPYPS